MKAYFTIFALALTASAFAAQKSAPPTSVTRSESLQIARRYLLHAWRAESRNAFHGSDPDGAQQLAWAVTYQRYGNDPRDTRQPYPLEGGEEEPLAAAITTSQAMDRRAMDPDDRRRFRAGAQRVAFFVTDEAGNRELHRASDEAKDQSYVLGVLTVEQHNRCERGCDGIKLKEITAFVTPKIEARPCYEDIDI